ncbi:MAG: phosphoribosyltransferase family protein [Luteolibacter sp.]
MRTSILHRFKNREDAGRKLARSLEKYATDENAVILAFPNGGVPVAVEIAKHLNKPMDVFLVSKICLPDSREIPLGAITNGGVKVLNSEMIDRMRLNPSHISAAVLHGAQELDRKEKLYRGDHPPLDVAEKTVILVNDGLTNCAVFRDAIHLLRQQHAGRIIVALPAASRHDTYSLALEADEVVTLAESDSNCSPEHWFKHFSRATDEKICLLLTEIWSGSPVLE